VDKQLAKFQPQWPMGLYLFPGEVMPDFASDDE
jgi:hypothetical protein